MLSPKPKDKKPYAPRVFLPYLILALGLSFTFLISFYFSKLANDQDQSRFNSAVQEIDDRIKLRVQTSIALLRAGTGLFAASESVDAQEFDRNYPGIQGIGYSQKLRPDERAGLIEQMKSQGFRDFKIWPEFERAVYTSVIYLQPMDNRNSVAIGFDMFSEPVRRAAMEIARDTGMPTASGKVTLIQEPESKQSGFLIYAPVYKHGADVGSVDARREALVGFVYSPFRTDDFLASILAENNFDVSFTIYDGDQVRPENLLHNSPPEERKAHLATTSKQQVAGRTWTIVYSSKPSFELASNRAFLPYTFAAGLLLSWLFFAVTRAEVHARARAERSAHELAESEATAIQTLSERELAEDALRESEERYRELVENANDIVYLLDFDGQITSINNVAEVILGYTQEELLQMNIADLLASESIIVGEQLLTSGHQRTNYEVEVVTKAGRVVTLETSNKLISRGSQPAGIQGIARDISTRRKAEEALREA
ncbi:MAG: hypothetical protein DMF69_14865, partial [Acidobacteria bacterium]